MNEDKSKDNAKQLLGKIQVRKELVDLKLKTPTKTRMKQLLQNLGTET